MSSPPPSALSPAPVSAVADTFGLTMGDEYWAVIAICVLFILYFIAFSYSKARHADKSDSASAAAGVLPAMQVRELLIIEASVFSHQESDGLFDDNDKKCAIGLNEFKQGQNCRMMKRCGHVFYRSCTNCWLKAEQHCPLCRSGIRIDVHPSKTS